MDYKNNPEDLILLTVWLIEFTDSYTTLLPHTKHTTHSTEFKDVSEAHPEDVELLVGVGVA
jgi:hypothetical protein